jgi:hypothetical protein
VRAAPSHENRRHFIHTLRTPCHHCRTPVTGWIVNVPVQAGGRPPGACRNVRRDDGGGGAPAGSAGSRISLNGRPSRDVLTGGSAKPATGEILAPCAGQRRPAVRVRVETGLWRAALRMREGIWRSVRRPGVPGSFTQGPARAGRCHPPLIAAHVRVAGRGTRLPVGCGHHPAKFGPARKLRHPACHRESGACTPNPLLNGTACARPSGLSFPKLRRRGARRVFVRRSRAEPDHPFRRYSLS